MNDSSNRIRLHIWNAPPYCPHEKETCLSCLCHLAEATCCFHCTASLVDDNLEYSRQLQRNSGTIFTRRHRFLPRYRQFSTHAFWKTLCYVPFSCIFSPIPFIFLVDKWRRGAEEKLSIRSSRTENEGFYMKQHPDECCYYYVNELCGWNTIEDHQFSQVCCCLPLFIFQSILGRAFTAPIHLAQITRELRLRNIYNGGCCGGFSRDEAIPFQNVNMERNNFTSCPTRTHNTIVSSSNNSNSSEPYNEKNSKKKNDKEEISVFDLRENSFLPVCFLCIENWNLCCCCENSCRNCWYDSSFELFIRNNCCLRPSPLPLSPIWISRRIVFLIKEFSTKKIGTEMMQIFNVMQLIGLCLLPFSYPRDLYLPGLQPVVVAMMQ